MGCGLVLQSNLRSLAGEACGLPLLRMDEMSETAHLVPPSEDRRVEAQARRMIEEKAYRSEELFRGRKEILIVHNEVVYRLRCTRHDKLILSK
jgi:hemin uptake protein HemP